MQMPLYDIFKEEKFGKNAYTHIARREFKNDEAVIAFCYKHQMARFRWLKAEETEKRIRAMKDIEAPPIEAPPIVKVIRAVKLQTQPQAAIAVPACQPSALSPAPAQEPNSAPLPEPMASAPKEQKQSTSEPTPEPNSEPEAAQENTIKESKNPGGIPRPPPQFCLP